MHLPRSVTLCRLLLTATPTPVLFYALSYFANMLLHDVTTPTLPVLAVLSFSVLKKYAYIVGLSSDYG